MSLSLRRSLCGSLVVVCALVCVLGGAEACAREPLSVNDLLVDPLEPRSVRTIATRVADWQFRHPKYGATDWTNAVFYAGLMATHRISGDPKYLEILVEIGERARWRIGPRYRHADDHAMAQVYLELFRVDPDRLRYAGFQSSVERMMAEPPDWQKEHQPIDYWWSDALFMSPPALAGLASATGDNRYLDLMDRLWQESHDLLYDHREGLFHRDLRFREATDSRFWARGNAWVLAGLARLLDELPEGRPARAFYERLFHDLAKRVVTLQGKDGLWRTDLLSASRSDPGESSASALFCFGLAWGIEQELLSREEYFPAVAAAWTALYRNVNGQGRLGWVQKPGAAPGRVSARHSEVYGSGAFLLAAEQVLALVTE